MRWFYLLVLVVMLAACNVQEEPQMAGIMPLPMMESITGMQSVLNGSFGTFVMECEKYVLLAWPDVNNYNYVVLSKVSNTPVKDMIRISDGVIGNQTGMDNMVDMTYRLTKKGWHFTHRDGISAPVAIGIKEAVIWLSVNWAEAMPTIFVVPAGGFVLPEEYQSKET